MPRWFLRFFSGHPLDDEDFADLARDFPAFVDDPANAPHVSALMPGFFLPRLYRRARRDVDTLNAQWRGLLSQASEKRGAATPGLRALAESCSARSCPFREESGFDTFGDSHLDGGIVHLIKMAHPTTTPIKTFLDMTGTLRSRLSGDVKRVIITDPYVHSDKNENGQGSGHQAMLSFLCALGLTKESTFRLELTPSPKKWKKELALGDTPIACKVHEVFPNAEVAHHKQVKGTSFHDRFYLVVDGSGHIHGLAGPSLNGLSALAIVMVGDLHNEPCLSRLEQMLLKK